jgi:hypothetical protein
MRKMLLLAHDSAPKRLRKTRGTALAEDGVPSGRPLSSLGRLGREPSAEAIIFFILPILPILSKQFPQLPLRRPGTFERIPMHPLRGSPASARRDDTHRYRLLSSPPIQPPRQHLSFTIRHLRPVA